MTKMMRTEGLRPSYVVVHPLDDRPELKRTGEGLGPMAMSASVRCSLLLLRGYLLGMGALVLYQVLRLASHHGVG